MKKRNSDKVECLAWEWSRGASVRQISEELTWTLDPDKEPVLGRFRRGVYQAEGTVCAKALRQK